MAAARVQSHGHVCKNEEGNSGIFIMVFLVKGNTLVQAMLKDTLRRRVTRDGSKLVCLCAICVPEGLYITHLSVEGCACRGVVRRIY